MTAPSLRTRYLGLDLASPLVVAASPLTARIDSLKRLEDAGAAAAVLPSLFEQELEHDEDEVLHLLEVVGGEADGEASGFVPDLDDYHLGAKDYLEHVEAARHGLHMPVIGSLCASTRDGWVKYAKQIEGAGASALELNVHIPSIDPDVTSADLEKRAVEIVRSVTDAVKIPVAAKIGPFFTALANFCKRLVSDGRASGLVLFNRFAVPSIDTSELHVTSGSVLSTREDVGETLRWIGILHGRVKASLAASTGVTCAEDVVRLVLAGADATMLASAIIREGTNVIPKILEGVRAWLAEHEIASLAQVTGSVSHAHCEEPAAYERCQHMRPMIHYTREG